MWGVSAVSTIDDREGLVDTAAQSGLIGLPALKRLEKVLAEFGLGVKWLDKPGRAQGVGGKATVARLRAHCKAFQQVVTVAVWGAVACAGEHGTTRHTFGLSLSSAQALQVAAQCLRMKWASPPWHSPPAGTGAGGARADQAAAVKD